MRKCALSSASFRRVEVVWSKISNALKRLGFRSHNLQGYEAVHMIREGQVRWVAGDDLLRQIQFIDNLFELAA
jgi:hypothetical protein